MNMNEIIDVLQCAKRREMKHNDKINKLCTNPAESIGAKAIDEAIALMRNLQAENESRKTLWRDHLIEYSEEYEKIQADRDRLKQRCEAYDRACREHLIEDGIICFLCKNGDDGLCQKYTDNQCLYKNAKYFEFAAERFGGEQNG